MMSQGFLSNQKRHAAIEPNWQMTIAFDRLVREIEALGQLTSSITAGSSTVITFTTNDGAPLYYYLSGDQLIREKVTTPAKPRTLARGISDLSFNYFDSAGNATSTVADVWCIGIRMNVNQHGSDHKLETVVCPAH